MQEIKLVTKKDLDALIEIEESRFKDTSYSKDDYISYLDSPNYVTYVLKEDEVVKAFVLLSRAYDECEIYHVAVSEKEEGKGKGFTLLNEVFKILSKEGIKRVFLEVRNHNERAKNLYLKLGFVTYLERKNYYSNGDDALCMKKEF